MSSSNKKCNICSNTEIYSEYNYKSEELKEFCDTCGYYHTIELKNKLQNGKYPEDWTPEYENIEGQTGFVLKVFTENEIGHHTAPISKSDVKKIVDELKKDNNVYKFAISFKDLKGNYQTQIYTNKKISQPVKETKIVKEKKVDYVDYINHEIKTNEINTNLISDGYHTFGELYEHRIVLFIALCKEISNNSDYQSGQKSSIWRSSYHSDGSNWNGWFIMGIGQEKGEQITYHLPIEYWDETNFAETLEQAPLFDGHTSNNVLLRISKL